MIYLINLLFFAYCIKRVISSYIDRSIKASTTPQAAKPQKGILYIVFCVHEKHYVVYMETLATEETQLWLIGPIPLPSSACERTKCHCGPQQLVGLIPEVFHHHLGLIFPEINTVEC